MGENSGYSTAQAVTPMEAAYNMIEYENQELKNNIRELEARLQEFRTKEQKQEREYQERLIQERARCEQTIGEMQQGLDAEKERTNSLQKQLDVEQMTTTKLRQDILAGLENVKAMKKSCDAEKLRADDLQKKLTKEKGMTSRLQQEINQLSIQQGQTVEDKTKEVAGLENTVHSLRMELTSKNKKMRRQAVVFVLIFIITCLPSVYFYFQAQEYQSKSSSLSQQADRLRDESTSLTEENTMLKEDINTLRENINALKLNNSSLEDEKNDLSKKFTSLQNDYKKTQDDYQKIQDDYQKIQDDYQKIQPEYEFYHEYAKIVYDDDTKLYHQYGCTEVKSKRFWIYNKNKVRKDYSPCSVCNEEDDTKKDEFILGAANVKDG